MWQQPLRVCGLTGTGKNRFSQPPRWASVAPQLRAPEPSWVSVSVLCLLLDNEMERKGWTESLHCLHCAMLRTVTKVLGSVN